MGRGAAGAEGGVERGYPYPLEEESGGCAPSLHRKFFVYFVENIIF